MNGSDGTDYGTATAALFAGGALKGERVIADWPGLKETDLQDKRDLKPTTDLRSVLKGLLRDHLHVNQGHLEQLCSPTARPGVAWDSILKGLGTPFQIQSEDQMTREGMAATGRLSKDNHTDECGSIS